MADPTTSQDAPARRFRWRRWNNAIHRDAGYLVVGLTLVYAFSGLLVNHAETFNSDFSTEVEVLELPPIPPGDQWTREAAIVEALELPMPKSSWWKGDDRVELFYTGWSAHADLEAGVARVERQHERPVLKFLNDLHLNRVKGLWTVLADVYAIALFALALTGLFVLRGRKGLTGRGKWLVGAGVAIPVLVLVLAALL